MRRPDFETRRILDRSLPAAHDQLREALQKASVNDRGMMRIGAGLVRMGWGNEAADTGDSGVDRYAKTTRRAAFLAEMASDDAAPSRATHKEDVCAVEPAHEPRRYTSWKCRHWDAIAAWIIMGDRTERCAGNGRFWSAPRGAAFSAR